MNDTNHTEANHVTFIDLYYKGFHIGVTCRRNPSEGIWLDLAGQGEQAKEAIDQLIKKGFEPSWNKETTNGHLKPQTPVVTPPTSSQLPDLSINGSDGNGGTCPVHGTPLVWKSGISKKTNKPYGFWACQERDADGNYCKGASRR
jgi:hypothetical protein